MQIPSFLITFIQNIKSYVICSIDLQHLCFINIIIIIILCIRVCLLCVIIIKISLFEISLDSIQFLPILIILGNISNNNPDIVDKICEHDRH